MAFIHKVAQLLQHFLFTAITSRKLDRGNLKALNSDFQSVGVSFKQIEKFHVKPDLMTTFDHILLVLAVVSPNTSSVQQENKGFNINITKAITFPSIKQPELV